MVSLHRKSFSPWLLLLALGSLCSGVPAQSVSAPADGISAISQAATPTATLVSVIQKMGGSSPKDSLATANVTITAGSTTETGTMRIVTSGTTQTLEEINVPSDRQRSVFSEGKGLKLSKNKIGGMTFEESLSAQSALYILPWLSAQVSDPDSVIENLGIDNRDDKGMNHLRISRAFAANKQLQQYSKFTTRDIWLDPTSGLPSRISYERRRASGAVPAIAVSVEYADYRRVGGFLYPFSIRKFVNGTLWADIRVQTVVFDTNIPDSTFSAN